MTKEDVKKVLTILQSAYPGTYRAMSVEEKKNQIELYQTMLSEYALEVVVYALKNYIKANQYPPTIAGLIQQIVLLQKKESSEEMWNKLLRAISNSAYNSKDEFDKLPKPCRIWLGSAAALRELGQIESNIVNTVTRGQFLKAIPDVIKKEDAIKALPENIMKLIGEGI